MTWRKQVEEHFKKIRLKKEDAIDIRKRHKFAFEISRNMKQTWSSLLTQNKPDFKKLDICLSFFLSLFYSSLRNTSCCLFSYKMWYRSRESRFKIIQHHKSSYKKNTSTTPQKDIFRFIFFSITK